MTARDLPPELKRAAAEQRVARAKQVLTKACRALLDQHPLAAALSDAAAEELSEARAELARLDAKDSEV